MLKLEGMSLSITVPVSILKSIGSEHVIPQLNNYLVNFINGLRDKMDFSENDNTLLKEVGPYLSNCIFAPTILKNMIIHNITFSQAIEASADDMDKIEAEAGAIMIFLGLTGTIGIIDGLLNEISDQIIEPFKNGEFPLSQENEDTPFITIPLSDLPQATLYSLDNHGIYKIAEQAAHDPQIRSTIQNKLIDPMIESYLKVEDQKSGIMTDITVEDKKELQDIVTDYRDEKTIAFSLQAILSLVLTKAITDNITFSQAAAAFSPETYMNKIMKKIQDSPDLMKYRKILEDIVKLID